MLAQECDRDWEVTGGDGDSTGGSDVKYADDLIGYDSIKYVLSSGHVGYWSGDVRRVGRWTRLHQATTASGALDFETKVKRLCCRGCASVGGMQRAESHVAGSNRVPEVCLSRYSTTTTVTGSGSSKFVKPSHGMRPQ